MTTQEFIAELRTNLAGEVSTQVVRDNVEYYQSYIQEQIASGKSESQVLSVLGDPRLIAKTIIETSSAPASGGGYEQNTEQGSHEDRFEVFRTKFDTGNWMTRFLIIAVPVLILIVFLWIIFKIIKVLFWPAVLLVVVLFLIKVFQSKK